jgi:hypothetical protein
LAGVSAFTGQSTPAEPSPNPYLIKSWGKQFSASGEDLLVNVGHSPSGAVATIQCSAEQFDPAASGTATQVAQDFALCTSADFPGAEPVQAASWVARQTTLLLEDLQTMPVGLSAESATPTFGSAVYQLIAHQYDAKTSTITLYVFGVDTAQAHR